MIQKTIKVGDKDVTFKSSASIPMLYRVKFRRDLFKDMAELEKAMKSNRNGEKEYEIEDLEIFENVAYVMACHADPTIPKTVDEWLDGFEMFSIFEILPKLMELWGVSPGETANNHKEYKPYHPDGDAIDWATLHKNYTPREIEILIKKNTPKDIREFKDITPEGCCPSCKITLNRFATSGKEIEYCGFCGQKLKWVKFDVG